MTGSTVAIGCVQNEADIIEQFVRHTLGFADRMVLVLHRSVDTTGDILRLLQAEGLPLDIRWIDSVAYNQTGVLTKLLQEVQQDPSVNIVLPLDADEFLIAKDGSNARRLVETLPTNAVTVASMRMYCPSTNPNAGIGTDACPCRVSGDVFPPIKAIAIPRPLFGGIIAQGNHHYCIHGDVAPEHEAATLTLAHFPVRSASQLQAKAVCWIRESLRPQKAPNDTYHWREMFADLRAGKLETPADVRRWALQYAEYIVPGSSQHVVLDPIALPLQRYGHLAVRVSPRVVAQQLGLELDLEYPAGMPLAAFARLIEETAQERVLTTSSGTATVAATHATHVRHDRQEAIGG